MVSFSAIGLGAVNGRPEPAVVQFVRRILRSRTGTAGVVLFFFVVLAALFGFLIRPHDPTAVVGLPYEPPSGDAWLGTDQLGRDVLSRVLSGGTTLLLSSLLAAFSAYLVGVSIGVFAGYAGGRIDFAVIAVIDILLSVPPLIFIFVLLAGSGPNFTVVTVGIAVVLMPGVVRIARAAAREVVTNEFVEAAVARGESSRFIVLRELLPNLWTPLMADFGIRISYSVGIYAGLAFLGFGRQPPAADWGTMINENRLGFFQNPWAVVASAALIAALTISVNLVGDAYARSLGRSVGDDYV
ncbi:ABC transporter permease [Kribbella speibonae]|uniref:ABC transporter permease n=1 Tax=Kribbella speibonae TaxID=1572660 RepID=A0A4V6N467_9ACTN|nr:ABC transporter permease [Kribbella speibonae]TCC36472.1 ABC transporter permease [Kribbella speibonae]